MKNKIEVMTTSNSEYSSMKDDIISSAKEICL